MGVIPWLLLKIQVKSGYYHYTNLTFVCLSVRAGGHGKPFDPS